MQFAIDQNIHQKPSVSLASLQGTSTYGRVYSLNIPVRFPASWLSELLLIPQGPFCRLLLAGDLRNSCTVAYNTPNAQLPSTLFSSLITSHHAACWLCCRHTGFLAISPSFWAQRLPFGLCSGCSLQTHWPQKWHVLHICIHMSPSQRQLYLKLQPLCSDSLFLLQFTLFHRTSPF